MDKINWKLEPKTGEWATSTYHSWASECGRYVITRIVQKYRGDKKHDDHFGATSKDGPVECEKMGPGYPKYYGCLVEALDAVERYHRVKVGENFTSNREDLLMAARSNGLATVEHVATEKKGKKSRLVKRDPQAVLNELIAEHGSNLPEWADYHTILKDSGLDPEDVTPEMLETANEEAKERVLRSSTVHPAVGGTRKLGASSSEGRVAMATATATAEVLEVKEEEARRVLVALGNKDAADPKKYSPKRLEKKLNDATGLAEALPDDLEDKEALALVKRVTKHLGEEGEVAVVSANGKPAKKAAKKGSNGKPSEPVKLNKFGSREGSSNAKVDAALGKKPLTFMEIVEKTGLSTKTVRYAHLHELVKKGFAKKTDEGWALKK